MYDKFLQNVRTRREAEELSEEANLIRKGIYEEEGYAYESYLENKVRAWVATEIRNVFAKKDIDKEKFLQGLIDELKNLKAVRLVIAFEPTQGQLERFSSFVKGVGGQNVIIDLTYDPYVIGGAVVVYEGKYKDYSFKKLFEYQFEKERESLLKLLDKNTSDLNESGSSQD